MSEPADRQVKEQAVRLLARMQARLDVAEARPTAPIAILGMGLRLPEVTTAEEYWAALAQGRDLVREVPAARWYAAPGSHARYGGFLDDVELFDAEHFGISPREARAMDPQQRLVLEVAWHALEDAGIAPDRLAGTRTGVFLGSCTADYGRLGDAASQSQDGYAATGTAPGVAAGRLAYALGLGGPALVVDTACSSSLVAVHLAMQSLRANECDLALAGGVNLTLAPFGALTLRRMQMLAPDGRCKAFDARADGFVRAEGCGILVLRRLADALATPQRVRAVLRGSAANQDGRSAGLTAPSAAAQMAVIGSALAQARLAPAAIDVIEAHGTGTALGDPIELRALAAVFKERDRPLWVGSVKSNLGHAEAAAGVAGLIKAVLMIEHKGVPASLHFQALNPHVELGGVDIRIPTALEPLAPRAIGVSSFGFGGTNAHIIVAPPPPAADPAPGPDQGSTPARLLIAARTPAALAQLVAAYRELLSKGRAGFTDVAFSAAMGRARLPWWVAVERPEELADAVPSDAPPPEPEPLAGRLVTLPLYPFERQPFWWDEPLTEPGRRQAGLSGSVAFEGMLRPTSTAIAAHVVEGRPIVPAAGLLLRLAAAAAAAGRPSTLVDVQFLAAVEVASPRGCQIVVGRGVELFVEDPAAEPAAAWRVHVRAGLAAPTPAETVDLDAMRSDCATPVASGRLHAWLAERGLVYGAGYDLIRDAWRGPAAILARLDSGPPEMLLDAALRCVAAWHLGEAGPARLPAAIRRFARLGEVAAGCWAVARVKAQGDRTLADVWLLDETGRVLVQVDELELRASAVAEPWRSWLWHVVWKARPGLDATAAAILAELPDGRALGAALDRRAAGYAAAALAAVPEHALVPTQRRLHAQLQRLAGSVSAVDTSIPLADGPEGALLQRCGSALPAILEGRTDPLSVLFADGGPAAIYAAAPVYQAANRLVAAAAAFAAPPAGRIRILEIGGGTGGTTAAVLAALGRPRENAKQDPSHDPKSLRADGKSSDTNDLERYSASDRVDYLFTDLSPAFLAPAASRFPGIMTRRLDIERALGEQAIEPGSFDLVIAANVLHATADLRIALRHAASALTSGGALVLLESTMQGGWIDLVFGLSQGWWRFTDTALRPAYPLLERAAWQRLLAEEGFAVRAIPGEGDRLPGQTVLLARRALPVHVIGATPDGSLAERCAAALAACRDLPAGARRVRFVTGGLPYDPADAALWGVARTLRLERPELEVACCDGAPPEGLAEEAFAGEPEVRWQHGQRLVPRLEPLAPTTSPMRLDPAAWYLVTGAFGGLGPLIGRELAAAGARHLVLTGRHVPTDLAPFAPIQTAARPPGAAEAPDHRVELRCEACDLTIDGALDTLLDRLPPIRGVVHAAGLLADATLDRLTEGDLAAVLTVKVEAALTLDRRLPDADPFILMGSAVGLMGSAGQAAHVAASLALDALAARRRAAGRSAVSIGWGAWDEVGKAAGRDDLVARLRDQGLGTLSVSAAADLLGRASQQSVPAFAALPIDPAALLASFAPARPPALLADWPPAAAPSMGDAPAAERPVTSPPGLAASDAIAAEAAAVLGYDAPGRIPRRTSLFELGLDSLMAVSLRNRLFARFGEPAASATLLFDHPTLESLEARLQPGTGPRARPQLAAIVADAAAPIAIIGIGCRFPQGEGGPDAYFDSLLAGRDAIRPMPPDRPEPFAIEAGFLSDVAGFDAPFFGISPREAPFIDPQHRLLLEVAWEALEDAAIAPDSLMGSGTGVFVGMCNYDYAAIAARGGRIETYAGTGAAPSIAAGRLAYTLGLNGPALVVDTACSASLVTVHLAVQSLRRGECGLALAGGVNLILGPGTSTALGQLQMMAPDARCKAFDARADGFVRGEGCGLVVLKRLGAALADGDRVITLIRGTAVNQDGRSAGLTAPSGAAQGAVIRAALADAALKPDSIDVIEAHGTGTALGDPIELHALRDLFGRRDRPLWVGAVKTNIGHAEAAAGIAGLIKAAMTLERGRLPPNLHFTSLNPHIDLGTCDLRFPAQAIDGPFRFAGVSSFGFSGTNAHVILEAPPTPPAAEAPSSVPTLLLSARSPEALATLKARYSDLLAAAPASFGDVAFTTVVGRQRLEHWLVAGDPAALADAPVRSGPPPELPPQFGRKLRLPTYPFERRPYWVDPPPASVDLVPARPGDHPLLGHRLRSSLPHRQFEVRLAAGRPAWLADHRIEGRVVLPAAVMVEMMLAAVDGPGPIELRQLRFLAPVDLGQAALLHTVVDPDRRSVRLLRAPDDELGDFAPVASADFGAPGDLPGIPLGEAAQPDDLAGLYAAFARAGLDYGPAFRALLALERRGPAAWARLADADPAFRLDPRLLDAAWQSLAALLPRDAGGGHVLAGVDRLSWFGGTPVEVHATLEAPDRFALLLLDARGGVVAACAGVRLARLAAPALRAVIHDLVLREVPPEAATAASTLFVDVTCEIDPLRAFDRVRVAALRAAGGPQRLVVLTRGALSGRTPMIAGQAALTGLVGTIAAELPELDPVLLDSDAAADSAGLPALPSGPERRLAWRDGRLWAQTLVARAAAELPEPGHGFRLRADAAATTRSLAFGAAPDRRPGPGEVLVEVAAAGINFRDVMNLMGLYPGAAGAPGVECAGTVVEVGAGVDHLAPGNAILGIGTGCFADRVVIDARLARIIPPELDWTIVAAQPVAFLTAELALEGVSAGQRVLVHAAAGGVGQAVLALARERGAKLAATAGSTAKRDYLRASGIADIFDSRTLDFASAAPVDRVVNCLSGEAIAASLDLLQPGGCFVELGRAGIWTAEQVHERRPDVAYNVTALDRLILDAPDRVGAMLGALVAGLAGGRLAPLPVRKRPLARLPEAVRELQAARHIGKLVLVRRRLRADATYLVTGGTGALGRELLAWLVQQGARDLLVVARRRPVQPLSVPGADLRMIEADIADETMMSAALSELSHPLKGVFHLAGGLEDGVLGTQDGARVAQALRPKLDGALVLDRLTRTLPLDHFVLFGSLAGLMGAAGQANYAAANAALAALVDERRARGRPALLVDWAAWAGAGMAAGRVGPAMAPAAALAALGELMADGTAHAAVLPGDAATAGVTSAGVTSAVERLDLAGLVPSERRRRLEELATWLARETLALGDLPLDLERPLTEHGLDSLMAVELRNGLVQRLGLNLPPTVVLDYPSITALTDHLADCYGAPVEVRTPPSVISAPVPAAAVDALDDAAVLIELEQELARAGY